MTGGLFDRILMLISRFSDRFILWVRLPFIISLAAVIGHRGNLRHGNLIDTETNPPDMKEPVDPALPADFNRQEYRMPDGSFNDLDVPWMGKSGQRFGRNIPLKDGFEERDSELMTPNPREISNRLMARKEFVPVPTLNVMAAAWIQFMVHDWLGHGPNDNNPDRHLKVPVPEGDSWPPDGDAGTNTPHMTVLATQSDNDTGPGDEGRPITFRNTETHWWDGSQLYGSTWKRQDRLRREKGNADGARLENGKLWLDQDGMLPLDEPMQEKRPSQELSGVNGNWWVGLSLLHTLFAREHNAIVDCLTAEYPEANGEWLFQKARLTNAALMAKIHTVEWTPALMDSPIGRMIMRGNYYGLNGEHFHKAFGTVSENEVVSGIKGTTTDHHGAPYSMTEEFTAVYRLHALLPDDFSFRSHVDDKELFKSTLNDVSFGKARKTHEKSGFENALYSLSTEHPGAMVLHNFPNNLRAVSKKPEEGVWMDLAAVDVLRDRERGVPRFNAFRKSIGCSRVKSFEELTSVPEDQKLLKEIYGDIDRVDLLIGCMAEFQSPRQPAGFGFSDTAFRIFIVMASRRLKSDRFYTDDYTPEMYTPAGYNWVQNNGFKDVLRRHTPSLEPHFGDLRNAFFPWKRGS